MKVFLRYWHTIKYLRFKQIYFQLYYRVFSSVPKDIETRLTRRCVSKFWGYVSHKPRSFLPNNTFYFLNYQVQFTEGIDWEAKKTPLLWVFNLHYFDDLSIQSDQSHQELQREIIYNWIANNPVGETVGWHSYPTSLRIVNLIKWYLSGIEITDKESTSLTVQVRHLFLNLEWHILGNHLFANLKALIFAGLFFDSKESNIWLIFALRHMEKQILEQVLPDGANFELSPMYHSIFLRDLLDIVVIFNTFEREVPKIVLVTIPKMVFWVDCMTHPNGEFAFFNDTALNVAFSTEELKIFAASLGFKPLVSDSKLIVLEDSGYVRIEKENYVCILDTAKVGPEYIPGHAHADTLSFELSVKRFKLIVNSGTSTYEKNDTRLIQRGTAAHSTVVIDNENSSEVWGSFRVARRALVFDRTIAVDKENKIEIMASHDGYSRLSGRPIHQRQWGFTHDEIKIEDQVLGSGFHIVKIYFPIHPDFNLKIMPNGLARFFGNELTINMSIEGLGDMFFEKSTYCPEFGMSIENVTVVYTISGVLPIKVTTRIKL